MVVGAIAGIGFTMSLFVSQAAFVDSPLLGVAKLSVLLGSGLSAALGLGLGWLLLEPRGRELVPRLRRRGVEPGLILG